MKINETNYINRYASEILNKKTDNKTENSLTGENAAEDILDLYQTANSETQSSYLNSKITMDSEAVNRLMTESDNISNSVQSLVRDFLERQGYTVDQLKSGNIDNLNVDEITQKKAQEMIGPGGELSPEKVSDRIVDFAIAAFGGDKTKIETIRNAIDQGFAEAGKAWGDELPEITDETYKLIQEKLDNWVGETSDTTA